MSDTQPDRRMDFPSDLTDEELVFLLEVLNSLRQMRLRDKQKAEAPHEPLRRPKFGDKVRYGYGGVAFVRCTNLHDKMLVDLAVLEHASPHVQWIDGVKYSSSAKEGCWTWMED